MNDQSNDKSPRFTEAQIEAYRSEWSCANRPGEPEWLREEVRLINWLCDLGLSALRPSPVLKGDVFLCRASGEGTQDFRICADEAAVFAFYKEMCGEDEDGTIDSITKSFADVDRYWNCEGRAFSLDLYMAQFEVWKVDASELALRSPRAPLFVPNEAMQDAARGILQILRGKPGATEHDVFYHCQQRGDSTEGLHENGGGYVTEARAAAMIWRAMARAAPQSPQAPLIRDALMESAPLSHSLPLWDNTMIVECIRDASPQQADWNALTYESGKYSITTPRPFTQQFVANLAARLQAAPSTQATPTTDAAVDVSSAGRKA